MNLQKSGRELLQRGDVKIGCTCLTGDTKIPLLDGRTRTMEELFEEYGKDKPFWVYSSDANGDPVPGKAYSWGVTKRVKELYLVTLDNDREIHCTGEHLFRLRDGSYRRADQLKENDSLMPLYLKEEPQNKKFSQSYLKAKLNSKTDSWGRPVWKMVHRLVSECLFKEERKQKEIDIQKTEDTYLVVHHKDCCSENNCPENLCWLGNLEHWFLHANFDKTNIIEAIERCWKDPEFRKRATESNRKAGKICFEKYPEVYAAGRLKGLEFMKSEYGRKHFSDLAKIQWKNRTEEERKDVGRKISQGVSDEGRKRQSAAKKKYWTPERRKAFSNKKKEQAEKRKLEGKTTFQEVYNHKVLKVEKIVLEEETPVYDLRVEKYQNFAVDAGVFVHNCPAQLYWGADYIISLPRYDAKYGEPEIRAPRVRNPKKYGAFCKHLQAVFKVLPFYPNSAAKWIKEYHADLLEDTERGMRAALSTKKTRQMAARSTRATQRRDAKAFAVSRLPLDRKDKVESPEKEAEES